MKLGGILFFRMNSTRLPGKPLFKISNDTVISVVVNRVKKIKALEHFCIATSVENSDDPIEEEANKIGIDVVRGSLNDVMKRAIKAAEIFGYTDFIRLCGDRPFLDPNYYQELILIHKRLKNDLTTNIFPRTVPPGLSGEIINVKTLKSIIPKIKDKKDKEHLTQYFYNNPEEFKICNLDQTNKFIPINYNLTLDTMNDFKKIVWIYENLKKKDFFDIEKIMKLNIKWKNTNDNTWNT